MRLRTASHDKILQNPSMKAPSPRQALLAIGLAASALVAGSLALTALFDLHPCHLCIFQRLLFILIAAVGIAAALPAGHRGAAAGAILSLPLTALGAGVAAYQSWLQLQPPGSVSCAGGQPGPIERLVEWLGERSPDLFLATGFCEEEELVILGLSLANWALVTFCAFLAVGLWAVRASRSQSRFKHGGHS